MNNINSLSFNQDQGKNVLFVFFVLHEVRSLFTKFRFYKQSEDVHLTKSKLFTPSMLD